MPTATVVAARGVSPLCSGVGWAEATVAIDPAGAAGRLAVVPVRIPGRLGKLLVPQAVAVEPRLRGPPNLVVLFTQRSRKTSPRLQGRSPVFVVLHVSRRETA